ncbi:DsrE family protein [Porticoccus sp.]
MTTQDYTQNSPVEITAIPIYREPPYYLPLLVAILLALFAAFSPPAQAEPAATAVKVVYHIDDASTGRFALHIAEDHIKANPNMQIAMVAYAGGVDFLLKGATDKRGNAYEPDVKALLASGVHFKVCKTTLKFRDIPMDQVLDGMELVPSGTYEVIRLQGEEGYVYLKP